MGNAANNPSMIDEKFLGSVVVTKYISGDERGTGEIISYCYAPTVKLRHADGSEEHWRADLCFLANEFITLNYWRQRTEHWRERAEQAEKELKSVAR